MSVGTAEPAVEDRIRRLIVETLDLQLDPREIGAEDQLFGGDVGLNSMAAIEVIVAVEKDFGIEIPDEDLRVELFDTVKAMAAYIRGLSLANGGGGL